MRSNPRQLEREGSSASGQWCPRSCGLQHNQGCERGGGEEGGIPLKRSTALHCTPLQWDRTTGHGTLQHTNAPRHRVRMRLQGTLDEAARMVQQARGRWQEHVEQLGDEQGPLVREDARHVIPGTKEGIGEVCAGMGHHDGKKIEALTGRPWASTPGTMPAQEQDTHTI